MDTIIINSDLMTSYSKVSLEALLYVVSSYSPHCLMEKALIVANTLDFRGEVGR